jgi:hypothetical protein
LWFGHHAIRASTFHYTPTFASWINQVERWLGLITQQALRRGSLRSVKELMPKIDAYVCTITCIVAGSCGPLPPTLSSPSFNASAKLLMEKRARTGFAGVTRRRTDLARGLFLGSAMAQVRC